MNITDIRIKLVENDEKKLRAFASITIDECFVVHDIKLIDGKDGLFISMPSKKKPDGEFRDIAHPIKQETRVALEKAIIEAYNKVVSEQ